MLRFRLLIGLVSMFALAGQLHGQVQNLVVKAYARDPSDFFMDLSLQSGVNIIFSDNVIEKLQPITLEMKGVSVEEILQKVLEGSEVSFRYIDQQIVLYETPPPPVRYTISGVVMDSISGEPLISAYVFDAISNKGTVTNNYGYYNLNLEAGPVQILSGYLGYATRTRKFNLDGNAIIHLRLRQSGLLPEIIVNANETGRGQAIVPPAERITLYELQNNIHLGGSSDLYRAADFIPGVHTGTDGIGGIHVRGGGNDQNLILMDGVPVYHPNHLLGIVSVFNYQALQQASIYKANFPSRFSGRLSSVMDVRLREGNMHEWGFSGNIATSEIGMMAEGPLVKDKVGILVSSRFFLPGLFIRDLTRDYKARKGVGGSADLDYFDFNSKINWIIGQRDRLYLSLYQGSDRFADQTITDRDEVDEDSGVRIVSHEEFNKELNWTNRTGVLRWNHIVNDQIFSNLIVSRSSFVLQSVDRSEFNYSFPGSGINTLSGFDAKEFKSGIEDVTVKLELDIRPSADHQLSAGIYAISYKFQPKSITINEESKVGDFFIEEGLLDDVFFSSFKVKSLESGVYFEDKWDISTKFRLSSGMHISGFFVQGVYYLDPQLRLSLDYMPTPKLAFNIGYSRMAQYLHNLTSSSIGLPTDLWVPTTANVSPALSDQYAVSGIWKAGKYSSFELSAYLKSMRSLISYQEGASFLLKEGLVPSSIVDAANWESKITEGTGEASGVELQYLYDGKLVQFKWNATWSRSYRQFDEINNGLPYPDRYDRRWSSTFSGQIKLGPRWTCGANWLYGTGIGITLAESKFFNPGSFFPEIGINYSERNGFVLPDYHRLDLSVNYLLGDKENFNHSLTLNLYNVYSRVNPFYITLVQDPVSQDFEFRQFSLFRFFPSFSYRFSFH
ncbi:MAG: TonB-dependent receptor [Saprospiraceae bacterium]|nr:TonB-dependent receptor [Candidatus Opimibacter skivensis]